MSEINRDGTINAIEWLEEESYKELYEKAKNDILELQQHYEHELEENKELKQENEELKAGLKKIMWEIYQNIQFQKSLEEYAKQIEEEEKAQK